MKIIRGRELRFNMGNFEHFITSLTLEMEGAECEPNTGKDPARQIWYVQHLIEEALQDDVTRAAKCTAQADSDTFVNYWKGTQK